MSSKYSRVYEKIPVTTLENAGFPMNYNYLRNDQALFFEEIVEQTISIYKDQYLALVGNLKEELDFLSERAQEVLNEYK